MASGQKNTPERTHVERRTIALRNAYPVGLRQWGMLVTVFADPSPANNVTYELKRGLSSTSKSDNNNWQEFSGSGGGTSTSKKAYFDGDGVTTVFTIVDADTIEILLAERGGQIYEPTAGMVVFDNAAKTVTFGTAPPLGVRVGVYYFAAVSLTTDFLSRVIVDTTGATIPLNLNDLKQRMFVGSDPIAAPKVWALDNDSNALVFQNKFSLTGLHPQTMPASFKMQSSDPRWNSGTKVWTPAAIGDYEASATFDGTNWNLKISDPFN